MSARTTDHHEGRHLGVETLADLQEGLLEPTAAGEAVAHLSGCAVCQADQRDLDRVRSALGDAGDVGPMPSTLAARLDAALTGAPDTPGSVGASRTVTPLQRPAHRASHSTRVLQAAAVAVLLLAGGAIGVSAFLGGQSGQVADSAGEAGSAAPKAAPGEFPVIASGTDYTAESVATAVPRLLGTSGRALTDAQGAEAGIDERAKAYDLRGGEALADCVTNLAGGPVTPVGVDLAEFNGKQAAVIVLPTPGDATHVDVFAVEPSCPPGGLLHFARVARP